MLTWLNVNKTFWNRDTQPWRSSEDDTVHLCTWTILASLRKRATITVFGMQGFIRAAAERSRHVWISLTFVSELRVSFVILFKKKKCFLAFLFTFLFETLWSHGLMRALHCGSGVRLAQSTAVGFRRIQKCHFRVKSLFRLTYTELRDGYQYSVTKQPQYHICLSTWTNSVPVFSKLEARATAPATLLKQALEMETKK